MLHVLRHYLPIRKALLVGTETVLLTAVVFAALSGHLWLQSLATARLLAKQNITIEDARWRCLLSAVAVAALAQIAISFNELYDIRVSSSRYDRSRRFVGSAGSAMVLVLGCAVLAEAWGLERVLDFPGLPLSQRLVLLTFALLLGFALLYPCRAIFHFLLRRSHFNERVLVIGSGSVALALVDELHGRPDSGYEVVGLLSDLPRELDEHDLREPTRRGGDPRNGSSEHAEPFAHGAKGANGGNGAGARTLRAAEGAATLLLEPALSTARATTAEAPSGEPLREGLLELVQRLSIDCLVVVMRERRGSLPVDALLRCRLDGRVVEEGEALYERVTGKLAVEALRPSYLIFNPGFAQHPLAQAAKRVADVVLALVGLVLAWPLMLATAILVKLDSPGPVLFRQERSGKGGRPFTLYKFRSMNADAEKTSGPVWASENDPRVTRIGRFLRKARLDELPQLFNVLVGDMSLVGPRPERPHFVRELSQKIPYYDQRGLVKPGLTGWAQINYPYGNTVADALQKLQYDLFYIKNQSLIFDLSILFTTVKTVVLRKGT